MKKLHLHLLKIANWLLASMLVLLGFSCTAEDGEEPIVCEYGVPRASFHVKGKVIDTKGYPIPDIQIRVRYDDKQDYWMHSDTVYSDQDGQFEWRQTYFPLKSFTFISGEKDKSVQERRFASDTTQIVFDSFVNGDGWYSGEASKETDITLKDYTDPHTDPYSLYTIYGKITDEKGYPLPGILLLTNPSYTIHMDENDPASYPAITDERGQYRFTYDKATATKHMIHTQVFTGYWVYPDACSQDSVEVDFAGIELSSGKGMLTGEGSKEVNFKLKRKY